MKQPETEEPKYACPLCGAPISPSAHRKGGTCRACAIKRISEKAKQRWAKLNEEHPLFCAWCGKQMEWNMSRKHQHVETCSKSCQSYLMQSRRKETKEHLEERLIDYIKQQDHYVPLAELRQALHLSDKLLYARGISCPDLNLRAGKVEYLPERTKTRDELIAEYRELLRQNRGIRMHEAAKVLHVPAEYLEELKISSRELRKELGIANGKALTRDEMHDMLVDWLRTQPGYVPAQVICKTLHIDYYCAIQKNGLRVPDLNREAGHKAPDVSYYEDYMAYALERAGLQFVRQKTFPDCKKKNKLRFDFWLPDYNVLIEVNGEQHYDPRSFMYPTAQESDLIKQAYAAEHAIPLYSLPAVPQRTFKKRIGKLIGIIKGLPMATCGSADSVELLEASAGDAGGNQQPRLEKRSQPDFFLW